MAKGSCCRHAGSILFQVLLTIVAIYATVDSVRAQDIIFEQNDVLERSVANPEQKVANIVILYDERTDLPGLAILNSALTNQLYSDSALDVELFREELDSSRFDGDNYRNSYRHYLEEKYASKDIDVVVAVMGSALDFILEYGTTLFPNSKFIFTGVDKRELPEILPENITGVLLNREFLPNLELALHLHPNTKHIAVVAGASEIDRRILKQAVNEFQSYAAQYDFTYYIENDFAQILEQLTRLPENSIVLFTSFIRDSDDKAYISQEAIEQVSVAANAPVYGFLDQYLGHGIIGGYLYSLERQGTEAAQLVLQVLRGVELNRLPIVEVDSQNAMFDGRQLRRWDIRPKQLPLNSEVKFNELSTLEQHAWTIAAAFILIVGQASLIGFLLWQRSRLLEVESGLRKSEAKYRQLIETQSDLVCRYLPDATLTFVNEAYCRYFGKSREQLVGAKFLEFLPQASRAPALEHIQYVAEQGKQVNWEHEVLLPDGSIGWHHWVDLPIYDRDGSLVEFQAIGRDMTDRKRAEEAQKNLSHALRLAVAGELTAMVAHEVSQPLGAIMANADAAQLLLDQDDPPLDEVRNILSDIRASNEHANQSIHRVRSLMRRSEIQLQPMDINTTITETLKLVGGDALARSVKIHSELYHNLPQVLGDHVYLQQVLLNLIINSMDAMRDTPITARRVTVKTSPLDTKNLCVAVTDGGPGIKVDSIRNIFDSFYTTKKDGMGLGLAISRSIIETHKGKIWAENNPEGGTTFQFSLQVA